ncbi:MAG: outer membrane beta-barrel protein [Nibricoccus sp.]
MKTLLCLLVALLVMGPVSASPGFYVEAGGGHASFSNSDATAAMPRLFAQFAFPAIYRWSGKLTSEQKTKNFPVLSAGYRFDERFGIHVSYQSVRNLTAQTAWEAQYVGGMPVDILLVAPPSFYTTIEDNLHVVSVGPEAILPLVGKLSVMLSPEVNWVRLRRQVHERFVSLSPTQHLMYSETDDKVSAGVTAGLVLGLTEKLQLSVRYKYVNFNPSFARDAHEVFATLRWNL